MTLFFPDLNVWLALRYARIFFRILPVRPGMIEPFSGGKLSGNQCFPVLARVELLCLHSAREAKHPST